MSSYVEKALEYLAAGLNVIPIKPDGTKGPDIKWGRYKEHKVNESDIKKWFNKDKIGIAAICGPISGNLEVLDFDRAGWYPQWKDIVDGEAPDDWRRIFEELPVVQTPSDSNGCRHVYLRSESSQPGQKLALIANPEDSSGRAWLEVIESRGNGQYAILPGSHPECHSLKREYKQIAGGDFADIPILTAQQRDFLFGCARCMTQFARSGRIVGHRVPSTEDPATARPGSDYSERGDFSALLDRNGWTLIRETEKKDRRVAQFWQRPGKRGRGISATLGFCETPDGAPLLYVFSTNAAPLEADKAYTAFGALAILEHDGDFRAAASKLASEGYGRTKDQEEVEQEVSEAVEWVKQRAISETYVFNKQTLRSMIDNLGKKFEKTWERKRDDFAHEKHKYDSALIWHATKSAFSVRDTVALVFDHHRKHEDDPGKALDVGYIAGKIAWFRSHERRTEDEAMRDMDTEEVSKDGDKAIINRIRSLTHINGFAGLRQYGREDPVYEILIEGGKSWKLGGPDKLMTWRGFAQRMVGFEETFVPKVKDWEWEQVVKLMLRVNEVIEIEELEFRRQIGEWVDDYLIEMPIFDEDEWKEAVRSRNPFRRDGHINIDAMELTTWVKRTKNEKMQQKEVYSGLKSIGFERKTIPCQIDGKTTSRSYYRRKEVDD